MSAQGDGLRLGVAEVTTVSDEGGCLPAVRDCPMAVTGALRLAFRFRSQPTRQSMSRARVRLTSRKPMAARLLSWRKLAGSRHRKAANSRHLTPTTDHRSVM